MAASRAMARMPAIQTSGLVPVVLIGDRARGLEVDVPVTMAASSAVA